MHAFSRKTKFSITENISYTYLSGAFDSSSLFDCIVVSRVRAMLLLHVYEFSLCPCTLGDLKLFDD